MLIPVCRYVMAHTGQPLKGVLMRIFNTEIAAVRWDNGINEVIHVDDVDWIEDGPEGREE